MSVIHRYHIFGIALDRFLVLVGNGRCTHLYEVSEINGISQHLLDRTARPKMMGLSCVGNTELFFLVVSRRQDTFFIKGLCDLVGTDTACTHFKHTAYITGRRLVTNRQTVFILTLNISVRCPGCSVLSRLCVGFNDRTDLLAGIGCVPFIEDIHNRHHIHTGAFAVCGIYVVAKGNKSDIVHREDVIRILTHLNVVSSETAEILDDDYIDPAYLGIFKQPLYTGAIKRRS